ncbi:MAG: hypothetical protein JWM56_30 [Candidatus Peribacteria bacterium]|nr:hypothetical protein [Candidatus Peribacteria bacterium]
MSTEKHRKLISVPYLRLLPLRSIKPKAVEHLTAAGMIRIEIPETGLNRATFIGLAEGAGATHDEAEQLAIIDHELLGL